MKEKEKPMKRKFCHCSKALAAGILALATIPLISHAAAPSTNAGYSQLFIVSDIVTVPPAAHQDSHLVNPWGIVASPSSVWVNDNGPGLLTTYSATGNPSKTTVNIPGPGGGSGTPNGLALNTTGEFVITNGSKHAASTYLMATEDGTIVAWNQSVTGTNAVIVINRTNVDAVYKGVAIALDTNGAAHIYASNFHSQMLDEFDGHFNYVQSFTDPNLPGAFAPFNVRTIRGRLFVTFAKKADPNSHDDEAGPGNGFIDIFDTDGTLLRQFAAHDVLNSPWGMAVAPNSFGKFSHALLVGNFGDGKINAYDLLTGKVLGHFVTSTGTDLVIDGLWGLTFEKDEVLDQESNFTAQRLYFTAGPNHEADGVLGILRPVAPSFPPAR
jgi:uncharacterized protein (TIGR03118 family)